MRDIATTYGQINKSVINKKEIQSDVRFMLLVKMCINSSVRIINSKNVTKSPVGQDVIL